MHAATWSQTHSQLHSNSVFSSVLEERSKKGNDHAGVKDCLCVSYLSTLQAIDSV